MMAPHDGLERRVLAALDATPSRIPVVLGGCGSGRTTLLHAAARPPRPHAVPVHRRRAHGDARRSGFCRAVTSATPFPAAAPAIDPTSARARRSIATLRLLDANASADGGAPRRSCSTSSSSCARSRAFPGCATSCASSMDALAASGNRFVLTSRYVARAHRLLRDDRRPLRGHPPARRCRRPRTHRHAARRRATTPTDDREFTGAHRPGAHRRPRRVRARARGRRSGRDEQPAAAIRSAR